MKENGLGSGTLHLNKHSAKPTTVTAEERRPVSRPSDQFGKRAHERISASSQAKPKQPHLPENYDPSPLRDPSFLAAAERRLKELDQLPVWHVD